MTHDDIRDELWNEVAAYHKLQEALRQYHDNPISPSTMEFLDSCLDRFRNAAWAFHERYGDLAEVKGRQMLEEMR